MKRTGTFTYMSHEKLTEPNYKADELTDIYAFGVIMFRMITKRHPYVNQSFKDVKEFVSILKIAKMFQPRLLHTFS